MSIREALAAAASTRPFHGESPKADAPVWRREYRLAADSIVFAGHFPGHPILPAVVQCLMAQMLTEEGLGRPLRLVSIVQAKFTRVIGPDEDITVNVKAAAAPGHWDCALAVGDETAARLRLHLEEEVPCVPAAANR